MRASSIWMTCPIVFSSLIGCSFILEEAVNPESMKNSVRYHATSGNARKCIFAHSPRTFTIKSALFNAVGKHGEVAIRPDDVHALPDMLFRYFA